MNNLIPLLVAVPLLIAAIMAAANRVISRRVSDVLAISTSVGVTILAYLVFAQSLSHSLVYWFGGWFPRSGAAIGIAFFVDPFSGALALLAGVLVTSALIISWHYFEEVGTLFHVLLLVFLSAQIGFALTGDMFTLFVFFELMSVAAYSLTAYKIEESSIEGALNFAVTNTIGGYLLLFGIGLLYGRTGALNMAQMGTSLAKNPADGLVAVAFTVILCGLLTKGAIAPFHFWLDDAHAVAPTPVCILFSGIMVESALYAVARIYWTIFSGPFGPHVAEIRGILITAAMVTSVLGALLCLAQRHIKRMLAFSTISHSGLMMTGLSLFNGKALAGAGLYLLGHGMVKSALFICAGVLMHRFSSVDELDLWSKAKQLKWTALLVVAGALGLCGIPPFATFTGKALIDEAAEAGGFVWIPYLLAVTAALTAATVLRMAGRVFFGFGSSEGAERQSPTEDKTSETTAAHRHTPLPMTGTAGALLIISLVFAHLPGFTAKATNTSDFFISRGAYSSNVLHGSTEVYRKTSEIVNQSAKSYAYSGIALVLALIVCGLAISSGHFLGKLSRVWADFSKKSVYGLSYLHSGFIGDYVVWQLVGLAIFGVAMVIATR